MDARVIDSTRCFECSATAEYEHHVVPESQGGTKTVPLCAHCHGLAHEKRNLFRLALEGSRKRRESGKRPCGAPPFGWVIDREGFLVEHPAQQKAVRLMRAMRADGWGYRAIAAFLNQWRSPTKRGKRWDHATIRKLLAAQPIGIRPGEPLPEPEMPSPPQRFLPGQRDMFDTPAFKGAPWAHGGPLGVRASTDTQNPDRPS